MQNTVTQETVLTIIISTMLILLFVLLLTIFFFRQQKKRFLHVQEVAALKESFNQLILQSKLEIQERTLDHMAKELHANFSHLISLININLAVILPQCSGEVHEQVSETKSLTKQLMGEVKALSISLNTNFIMKSGFYKALENELQRLVNTKRYEVQYQQTGMPVTLPAGKEIVLFRLCQEILNNIIKHAKANSIFVNLDYEQENLYLRIADDGIGFDLDLAKSRSIERESTGLLNIAERARIIKGSLKITTSPGNGTIVELTLPLTN
ncbi:sensor histidine kinase [Mucilaginibacter sp. NFR10]|uniref:sensor histidine kinase n=1 Tax=Mucilaginibacter sp. NFR10 TaxID=1566292 RepID=UPI00087139D7|nr:ATP-binding protein [Mucilaginibacter sp. NFR10]SCW80222.1 Histidine kinase-, DNA gyrase B-, and HSP90-like ATPase [Mucilaginibacter sp. NFR10]